MKRTGVFLFVPILLATIIILAGCNSGRSTSQGRCLVTDNAQYLVITENEAIVMSDRSKKGGLFEGLKTGDKIEISHGPVWLSFPSGTEVYKCKLLENGTIDDVPKEMLETLQEMGWAFQQ